jgi:hypothetical protein
MNEESVKNFARDEVSAETISMLKAILGKSIPSRTFMLKELDGEYGVMGNMGSGLYFRICLASASRLAIMLVVE